MLIPSLAISQSPLTQFPHRRLRRLREKGATRSLVTETNLLPNDFVAPIFLNQGEKYQEEISCMPGVFRYSTDLAVQEAIELYQLGIQAVCLFPCIPNSEKDARGSAALKPNSVTIRTIQAIRQAVPDLCIIADVALDPFTDHGHDGIVDHQGRVLNDATLEVLVELSLYYAQAGADVLAPSDMMDGRVGAIRKALDAEGYHHVAILSHAAKFASACYGPYREVLQSAPRFGDKKGYFLNPANSREALLECLQDESEGADILMIKPALCYLDVITRLRQSTLLPIAAFHVSGEYAMVRAAAERGWIDGDKVMEEMLLSIKRAGANLIFSYAARWMCEKLIKL